MKGSIVTGEHCQVCNSKLKHDENRDGFVCQGNPSHPLVIPRKMRVTFGRATRRKFSSHRYHEARQFLEGLRFKVAEGTYDPRDYTKENPLGFINQLERYLAIKKEEVSPGQLDDIRRYLYRAADAWEQKNIKAIGYAEIQDFLMGMDLSQKSRSNARSALNAFFKWVVKREKIQMPEIPDIDFNLGWRNIVDIETQQAVLEELKRISWDYNPKIYVGVRWLATYISIRPNEMRQLREREININGMFVLPPKNTKEREPKLVAMLPEDIALFKSMAGNAPNEFFFRHNKGNNKAKAGDIFGRKVFYNWTKKALKNLGLHDIDLYGLTRHSTCTSLGEFFDENQIMEAGSMHKTNKAARRYIQARKKSSINIYQKIREGQQDALQKIPGKKMGNIVRVDFGAKRRKHG